MQAQPVNTALAAPNRIASIDILRALTMVLMIFVNDLWSLKDIPAWLEHVEFGVDGIGLADVVFPAFLFIVGLSVPFAIDHRKSKGDTTLQLLTHVLLRGIALLIMGLFLVNGESINEEATGMQRLVWNTLCCASFILIWNSYSQTSNIRLIRFMKITGVVTLLILAFIYRGGEGTTPEHFQPHWWGILGLIGWAYLASGLIAVWLGNSITGIALAWGFFAALSLVSKAGWIPDFLHFIPDAILGGTLTGLTLGGVLTSLIFQHFRKRNDNRTLTLVLAGFAVLLIVASVITRPYWGLAKLGATPAWLFLCSAFTILAFLIIYWIADVWGKSNWFAFIRPAGTDTLLCYFIPYFIYAFTNLINIHLPEFMLIGAVGLLKSFLFALLCVLITAGLMRIGIRLKL